LVDDDDAIVVDDVSNCFQIDFRPPPAINTDACAVLGGAGSFDGRIATTLIIANGRGNPDSLGSPAEYKLWVVGDSEQSTRYTLNITWFFGPDC